MAQGQGQQREVRQGRRGGRDSRGQGQGQQRGWGRGSIGQGAGAAEGRVWGSMGQGQGQQRAGAGAA